MSLRAGSVDEVWDALASQVAFEDTGEASRSVEERFEARARLQRLRAELAKTEAKGRKKRQPARKNALFDKVQELKRQIAALEEDR